MLTAALLRVLLSTSLSVSPVSITTLLPPSVKALGPPVLVTIGASLTALTDTDAAIETTVLLTPPLAVPPLSVMPVKVTTRVAVLGVSLLLR